MSTYTRTIIRLVFVLATCMLLPVSLFAQIRKPLSLQQRIQYIIDTSKAKVGVGILGLDFKDSLVVNNGTHYPMQSVFKFPLAIYILHQVDKGKLSLSQNIHIRKEELDTATWSPLVTDFPKQDIDITLTELLKYTISKSDNNGCDILFRLAGGPAPVNSYIHSLGVMQIAIKANEATMKTGWAVQYTNWCQPGAMLQLLKLFYNRKVLSRSSNDVLVKLMIESSNSENRLKGSLPTHTIVAHKTGTSNTNKKGITAATNDVGIVTLPNGHHYAIVVYVSDYTGGVVRGEHIIAAISKVVYDHYARMTQPAVR